MQSSTAINEWFAFRVKSRQEKLVSVMLRNRGFDEYLPLARSRRQWSDRAVTLDLPLFPGYIFCDIDRSDIGRIRTIPGIVDVVRAGVSPLPANRSEVEDLRQASRSGLDMESCTSVELELSDRVHINSGPLTGLEGVVVQHRGKERLVLTVDLLKRSVVVDLPLSSVSLCAQPPTASQAAAVRMAH